MKDENLENTQDKKVIKKISNETKDKNKRMKNSSEKDAKSEVIKEIENNNSIVDYNMKKKKNTMIFIIIIIALIIIIACLIICILKPNTVSNLIGDDKEKIELKRTEEIKVSKDGVYITDVSEVVEEVMPSIVAITSKTIINSGRFGPYSYGYGNSNNRRYTTEGAGSGVIVAADNDEIFILTNHHVVEGASELSVKFIDDESLDATIKGMSGRYDIAVVSVKKKDMKKETIEKIKIATIGKSTELKVGNGIIAIGNALGYGQSVTTGVVSALNREVTTDEYTQEMIQIDAAINGGNSGGALLNSKGEVVGINTAKYSSNTISSNASIEGMGFAIPISDVEKIIEDLINGKSDDNALTIGIEGYMTNSGEMSNYGLPIGFYISKISEDGNASKSELEIGNIITEIDGNKVTSLETIKKVLNKKEKEIKLH